MPTLQTVLEHVERGEPKVAGQVIDADCEEAHPFPKRHQMTGKLAQGQGLTSSEALKRDVEQP
jgi:hypothetical protein